MKHAITLKDGTIVTSGDIVRFRMGTAALMMIERSEDIWRQGKRIYGPSIYGDQHAAWASDCVRVTEQDRRHWIRSKGLRTFRGEVA